MSATPLLIRLLDEMDSLNERSRDNDGSFGLFPYGFYTRQRPHLHFRMDENGHLPQKRSGNKDTVSSVGKEGFQVSMDVQHFKPSELTVKTVDNSIVVEGKHEEREDDHGYISRHFSRRYVLPAGYDSNQVMSTLSSDGILTVKVPTPAKSLESNERIVQIQHTGPAHLSVKHNPRIEDDPEPEKD